MTAPDVTDPVFVVGTGRSGTTLMQSLLSAHPRVVIAPETHFMRRVARATPPGGGDEPTDFETFWREFTATVRFGDLGVDADRCLDLIDAQGRRTFRAVFVALLTAHAEVTGAARVGEKSPSHVRFMGELLAWFPHARFVIMRRDPRAVMASKLRNPFVTREIGARSLHGGIVLNGRTDVLRRHIDDYVHVHGRVVPQWATRPEVTVVAYEDLVTDPGTELRRVCAFLDEHYDPAMLTGGPAAPAAAPSSLHDDRLDAWRRDHLDRARGPVNAASVGSWRETLTPTEVALIEAGCAEVMAEAGYRPSGGARRRAYGRAAGTVHGLACHGERIARHLYRRTRARTGGPPATVSGR